MAASCDTGNRADFTGQDGALALHPRLGPADMDARLRAFAERSCAPLLHEGPHLRALLAALLLRTLRVGHALTADPVADRNDTASCALAANWR
jgi:hypothetical protein